MSRFRRDHPHYRSTTSACVVIRDVVLSFIEIRQRFGATGGEGIDICPFPLLWL